MSPMIPLPQDPAKVEEVICGQTMKRRGVLCGSCQEGYSPTVYSYFYTCIKCDEKFISWTVYILMQYLPILFMFVLVTFLNLTIVSPASNAFLFFSQISTTSNAYNFNYFLTRFTLGKTLGKILVDLFNTTHGIWNLDFFRALSPPICLFNGQNALFVLSSEYVAAFFPFLLVIMTYILITAYNKNFRILVWLWKPFNYCLNKLHSRFQPRASLVDAFVTFFFLSYVKVISTAFRFLQYVFVYDVSGNVLDTVFYYDGDIKYFQGIHLAFAIPSLISLFSVVLIPPLLLTFYQFKWFQRILERLHLRTQALITFVEVVQSGFTDGRDGTKDRRFFAGVYFLARIGIFASTTVISQAFVRVLLPLLGYMAVIIALVAFKPYQNDIYNKIDLLIFVNLLLTTLLFVLSFLLVLSTGATGGTVAPLIYITYLLGFLPMFFMAGYVTQWVFKVTRVCDRVKWCCRRRGEDSSVGNMQERPVVGPSKKRTLISASMYSVPDRIIQPEMYQSLILTSSKDSNSKKLSSKGTTITSHYASLDGGRSASLQVTDHELSTYNAYN